MTSSRANRICRELGLQGRVMWLDAEANIRQLSTREGVADTIDRCKAAGINTVVVDVKPLAGLVLYNSRIAPRLTQFDGCPYPEDHDLLAVTIQECRRVGIGVYAAINVFSEGSRKILGGPAWSHSEWQVVHCEPGGLRRAGDLDQVHGAVFVNPLHPEVRDYALSIVREICANYDVDGLVLDRMRYPNLYADFSNLTRAALEEAVGVPVRNWPDDVLRRGQEADDVQRGPLFGEWLKLRARVMREFLSDARGAVRAARPEAKLGIYVGSWYPLYFDVGVNWGSPGRVASYDWWPDGYQSTGYADLLDFMCTGCYYESPTRAEAAALGIEDWRSVEAAAEESIAAVEDATFVYGSLYLIQYAHDPARFAQAIKQCLHKTQGCMLFDLVYVRDYNWWSILAEAFATPAIAPHDVPGLTDRLRARP